jgi:hypothetical protein
MVATAAIPDDPREFFDTWLPEAFGAGASNLSGKSSPGSVVFRVGAREAISVRLASGVIVTAPGVPSDTIVQVSLAERDFGPVIVRGAELLAQASESEQRLFVLRALTLEAERAELIRGVRGSVAFVLAEGAGEHRIVLTPGVAPPSLDSAECSVRCELADFLALQRGDVNPFELMMNGKIQISGDAQIPLALSSLLA